MNPVQFLRKNLDHFKKEFFLIFLAGLASGAISFMIPASLAEFTRNNFNASNFSKLLYLIVGLYMLSIFVQWMIRKWGEAIGPQFANHIRLKYFKDIEKMAVKDLVNAHSGYLLSLIGKVAEEMRIVLFYIIWSFTGMLAGMSLFFYFTARESVHIAFLNLGILAVFVFVSTFLSRKMVPLAQELNKRQASLLESYADFVSNIMTVKRLGIYLFAENKLKSRTEANNQQTRTLQSFHANRWAFLHALFGVAFLSTIGFMLFRISQGALSPAILILFIAAYGTIRTNVEQLSENLKNLMQIRAYLDSLNKVIVFDPKQNTGKNLVQWNSIKLENVMMQYAGTDKKIIIPELTINKTDKICILGKSGEGKTTLLNLIANFLEPVTGERSIDGTNYHEVSQSFFRDRVAMISQEIELFNISLRDNLLLGQEVSEKRLNEILEKFDLAQWVASLDLGLETIVGEKGIKLSAGQKQRVNLIRGILLDRDILMLDEPTAHLDTATEAKIIEFLADYLKDKTVIIVSHREALRQLCQQCYSIKDHTLVQE